LGRGLDWMTHRAPSQPLPCLDSVRSDSLGSPPPFYPPPSAPKCCKSHNSTAQGGVRRLRGLEPPHRAGSERTHRSPPWSAACLVWGSQRGVGAGFAPPRSPGRCRICQRVPRPRKALCWKTNAPQVRAGSRQRARGATAPQSPVASRTAPHKPDVEVKGNAALYFESLPSRRLKNALFCGGRMGRVVLHQLAIEKPESNNTVSKGCCAPRTPSASTQPLPGPGRVPSSASVAPSHQLLVLLGEGRPGAAAENAWKPTDSV